MLIVLLISFFLGKLPINMKMLVFFLAKCVRTTTKTKVGDRKEKEETSSAILICWCRNHCEMLRCAERVRNRADIKDEVLRQIWTFRLNFFAYKIELFAFHQKGNWVFFWTFFFINKIVFDFCCLCLFCFNVGHHVISRQKCGIQHRVKYQISVCHFILVTLWCGRTVTWLLRHNQNFLAR